MTRVWSAGTIVRPRNLQLEYLEQCALLQWLETQYVRIPLGKRSIELCIADWTVASLNGVYLNGDATARAKQWARAAKAGAKKNAPDLSIHIPFGKYHGMHLEMKKARSAFRSPSEIKKAPGPGQVEFINTLHRLGYYAAIPYGWTEAAIMVCEYFGWDPKAKGLC